MKSLISYLLMMFAIIFWIFRIIVCLTEALGLDFLVQSYNFTTEIILLFITIISIVFVIKRSLIGGLLYFLTYGIYFGFSAYLPFLNVLNGVNSTNDIANLVVSFVAILLPICIIIDILLDKKRSISGSNKKTNWYYNNDAYDRKIDERADKNNYRIK